MTKSSAPRRVAVTSILGLLGFLVLGALGGVAWQWWWTPVRGVVINDGWIVFPDDAGKAFAATGGYLVGALALGVLSGLVTSRFVRPYVLAVVLCAVGGTVAGVMMAFVGHQLGPPDPRPLASGKADLTPLPADLRVAGRSPYLAFPAGALATLVVLFLGVSEESQSLDPAPPPGPAS